MTENDQKIKELEDRFDRLIARQVDFQKEMTLIRGEIVRLRAQRSAPQQEGKSPSLYVPDRPAPTTPKPLADATPSAPSLPPRTTIPSPSASTNAPSSQASTSSNPSPRPPAREASGSSYELPRRTAYRDDPVLTRATTGGDAFSRFVAQYSETARANLEEFVGKNLISLIGIVVLILGVGIGAKYAIDNNLISPMTRIIVGYIFGFGLVGLAIKLKRQYLNFSAVLISGGMAIMYFVTYFAYSAYGLISQLPTFGLMIMFTIFTVTAALVYSRQVIAHIGLVGAYAVPFLLSNDSGNYLALFIYVAVVNTGILAVSLKKDWKPIFYTASLFTWAIFCGWFATKYSHAAHFELALVFLGIFFSIFYATKLVQTKLAKSDADLTENLISTVVTTMIFYAVCFAIATNGSLGIFQCWTLFTYLAVFSIAMIASSLAIQKRIFVFYSATLFTWAIFCGWFATSYTSDVHFPLALTFLGIFLAVLYGATLIQSRILSYENDLTGNLITSLLTCCVFYIMCFAIGTNASLGTLQRWTFFTYLAVFSIAMIASALAIQKRIFVFYSASLFIWAIFCAWFVTSYSFEEHFRLALTFLGIFFAVLYGASLIQSRMLSDENDLNGNFGASLLHGFVFYAMCYEVMITALPGPAQYWSLFTYLAAGSTVILATSFKFFGRAFMYLVVPLTWGIFAVWFFEHYSLEYFALTATFTALFFAIFYFSILYHRLVEDNFTVVEHTSLILFNAFVAYGFGYRLLDSQENLSGYLGVYTAANAAVHLIVAFVINRLKPSAVDAVQVLTILVLTFASISIPVQFDGNAVTMIWATEAAILFWFGRTRGVRLFESYSYPVMIFAVAKLFLDWSVSYSDRISGLAGPQTPIANTDFITAIVFVVAFGFIFMTNRDRRYEPAIREELVRPFGVAVGALGVFVLYNMFRIEIGNYFFLQSVNATAGELPSPTRPMGDLQTFNIVWQINYTIFFLISAAAVNLKKMRSVSLAVVNSFLGALAMALFSTVGMFLFYLLREAFVTGSFNPDVVSHWMYIAIRPISYILAGVLLYMLYEYSRDPLLEDRVEHEFLYYGFESLAYGTVLVVASCELLNLMAQFGIPDGTKLGLSILWGIFALAMIVVGIARDKKHLRIAAMVVLAIVLAKLFLYDIADLDTIPKTILFVTLGITLLIVSFLYNKYKNFIFKVQTDE